MPQHLRAAAFVAVTLLAGFVGTAPASQPATQPARESVPWVEQMPRVPEPLHVIDWKETARDYYRLVFDPKAAGPGLPAVVVSDDGKSFAFPAYLGRAREPRAGGGEAIACLSAVAGRSSSGSTCTICTAWTGPPTANGGSSRTPASFATGSGSAGA